MSALFTVLLFSASIMLSQVADYVTNHKDFSLVLATFLGPTVAALLAAVAAIWVAVCAYPRQKEKDRQLDWSRDKRRVFADFLGKLEVVLGTSIVVLKNDSKEVVALNSALGELEIISTSQNVVGAAKNLVSLVNDTITREGMLRLGYGKMFETILPKDNWPKSGYEAVLSARGRLVSSMVTEIKEPL